MASKAYIGVNGVARKIKKGYIGVGGVARKILKAYIGVGGVARPCWSGGLAYYGSITPLSAGVTYPATASIPGYALFAGGELATGTGIAKYSKTIEAYDRSLTRVSRSLSNMVVMGTSTTTSLNARAKCSGASVGGVAIFAGGSYGTSSKMNDVFAVDASLVVYRVPQGQYMRYNCDNLAATTVGNYVLFANGLGADGGRNNFVEAYNSSMTKYSPQIENTRYSASYRAATTVGDLALVAGGGYGNAGTSYIDVVEVYDSSLTKNSNSSLSVARHMLTATTVNNRGLFAGGTRDGDRQSVVDSFDTSATRTTISPLSQARNNAYAVTINGTALFLGGEVSSSTRSSVVDAYDGSLTHTTPQPLAEGRYNHGVAVVGAFVVVAGGTTDSSSYASSAEAYVYS